MIFEYGTHVRRRMRQRGVTELDIEHCMANYHTSHTTLNDSICYIGPGQSGNDLKVWIVADDVNTRGPAGSRRVVKSVAWRDEDVQQP